MPAILSNAKNFLVNSDFPFDNVIYLKSDSTAMDSSTNLSFPHNLGFAPMLDVTWSYDSDFRTTYFQNSGPVSGAYPGYLYDLQVTVESDASNVYLYASGPPPTRTGYYRIFGFQPNDSNASIVPTVSSGDNFILNSSYNYTKLFKQGSIPYTAGAVSVSFAHNLGYYPQVQVWNMGTYTGARMGLIAASGDSASDVWQINITTTSLNMAINNIYTSGTLYYRIYLDES